MSNTDRKYWKRRHYIAALCCLLLILSGCASLFSGVSGNGSTTAPVVTVTGLTAVTGASSPTPASDSDLASKLVQGMTLDEKLGQMVIVEFYGSTLNADLIHMISIHRVSGGLIEKKKGEARS